MRTSRQQLLELFTSEVVRRRAFYLDPTQQPCWIPFQEALSHTKFEERYKTLIEAAEDEERKRSQFGLAGRGAKDSEHGPLK